MLEFDSYIQHYFMQCVLKVNSNNYKEMNNSLSGQWTIKIEKQ